MVRIDPEFVAATLPDDEKYEGTEVDANVLQALPSGITIKWSSTRGASFRAILSKLDTILEDGQEKSYFMKVYTLAAVVPGNVPKAVAYGVCASDPNRAFFLAEFRDMTDELPDIMDLVSIVAKIHQQPSLNEKFGFNVMTFSGKHASDNTWCDTWEEFFTRAMRDTMEAKLAIHGPDEELQELSEKILTKVIPRLIRPMETEGRRIEPVLLHGDLWHGNVSIDNETKEPVLYDPCCFYGHNDYDFGMWRASRCRMNRAHVQAYFKLAKITEPSEDQDDRQALYAMQRMRELSKEEMRRLVAKYGGGYEGYLASKEVSPLEASTKM
ncbi:Fructosamine kinase-domain-containing protein [Parachaetomium inaequale]|uniref:protein-ribulosamine 3-kinase n=1 Tax=Parachaetomium inaequale TaxID=2588326 RepID=A0AAN6SLB6_9PEZI|nr:Fructosamine kinase-domain-containing protein [Parachaetomium inaequale]